MFNFNNKSRVKIIVTAGPTREFVDPIRFLSNPSTGRMGYFIARACVNQGYKVTYIVGPVPVMFSKIKGAKNISIISTQDMLNSVLAELKSGSVLVMAAAPADYHPEKSYKHKIKKTETPYIHLVPNPDILKTVKKYIELKKLKDVILVGFAAETSNPEKNALKKLEEKKLDIIFLNDLSKAGSGFRVETNQLTVFRKDGSCQKWKKDTKERLGYRVLEEIEKWLES
ncbi:MAG: phosphopantothenoylcysteine decarboxylase [Spirochaetia bacterium]|nr:phosphopantothenoylcysteine decarboxylase [Spirochaetia bacterium]